MTHEKHCPHWTATPIYLEFVQHCPYCNAVRAAVAEERERWSKIFDRIAAVSCNSLVQAALWRAAEMLEFNQEHQDVQTNTAAIR